MWIDDQGNKVNDNDQYTNKEGTTYPSNFPKAEIPGLYTLAYDPVPEAGPYQRVKEGSIRWEAPIFVQSWIVEDWTQEEIDAKKSAQRQNMKVTMRQARTALYNQGKLAAVESAIEALPSPQKEKARIDWDYSIEVQRNWPLVEMMKPVLGMTDDQLDALFEYAKTL